MSGNRSVSRRSGKQCWAMFGAFSVGAFLLSFLVSPISAEDASGSAFEAYSEEGENLTTPATPIRKFVWRVRNWMFNRDDEDINIEVNTSESTQEQTADSEKAENEESRQSWARSVAAWFARGIRHLLEQIYPSENGTADCNTNGADGVKSQDGTTGGKPDDKPPKGSDAGDTVTKPDSHVFRPWTALPPPLPPGMTASPEPVSSTGSTPEYTKPSTTVAGKFGNTSGGKSSTPDSKSTSDGASSPKKPKRRRPKTTSTTTTSTETPEVPDMPPISTGEVYIQDTGNEIR